MCWTRTVPSKTQTREPVRSLSSAAKNIFRRSPSMSQLCRQNVASSVIFSFSAQVSSARPSVLYGPIFLAR